MEAFHGVVGGGARGGKIKERKEKMSFALLQLQCLDTV